MNRPSSRLATLQLSNTQLAALATSLREGQYNLFLGAGVSLDSVNGRGQRLPSSMQFRDELCDLTGARKTSSLQRAFAGLEQHQIQSNVTERFINCQPGPSLIKVPSFIWRRIFTLNIDDAIEAAYRLPGNKQTSISFHFKDPYTEVRGLEQVPIVHLHGWVRRSSSGYVFSTAEYAKNMVESNAWMTVLADIMPIEPFIIAGTSLDEVDIEYYLARRSATSAREDRGPSFFVEPSPDVQSKKDCERYGLALFWGTFEEFLYELDILVPQRAHPHELIPEETINLFPSGAPKNVVMSFSNDFELTPKSIAPTGDGIRFSYGNPPEWNDLARNWDVGRALAPYIRFLVEQMLGDLIKEKILIVCDDTGSGKTTLLRRIAYDLASSGRTVLTCSSLSRLETQRTVEAIDLIDVPLIILIDNFADQATAVAAIIPDLEKREVVFLCGERNYRQRHLVRSLGDIPYKIVQGLDLTDSEAGQLVRSYISRGLASSPEATKDPDSFARRLSHEPIAVACCHILNDMRPLDTIVHSTYNAASDSERRRYLIAALAQYCFSGGIRYEILASAANTERWAMQFQSAHPLPLAYVDGSRRNFIIPLNSTLAERTLARAPSDDVARAFERLARSIATRVNREAIRRRSPEARLAGRLFDYEDVVRKFLDDKASQFYSTVQKAWQWNSRYWEQVALYHLARFKQSREAFLLQQAIQHAKHAVAIELHPFPLTTLGKILLAQLGQPGISNSSVYREAQDALIKAIELEHRRGRVSLHAYVTLFNGTLDYIERGGLLSVDDSYKIKDLISSVSIYFPKDRELKDITERLRFLV